MDEKKQIDEMAKLICTYPQCIHHNIIGECANTECQIVDIAENLYKQGYRKQSEGEWIYHECVSSYDGAISGYSCSCCSAFIHEEVYEDTSFPNKFCPNCGAKMKGGAE